MTRSEYDRGMLAEEDLARSWHEQFQGWLDDAIAAELPEPNAMTLATAAANGAPGARTVLLRGVDERGFTFHTNHGSRKAAELAQNPRAALVFLWVPLQRQVVVDGEVERLADAESDAYWETRPYRSKLGALTSPQSQPIATRAELEERFAALAERYPEAAEIPRPDGWGGYRLAPDQVEFWHGRRDRLHDRLRYRRDGDAWVVERLAP